MYQSGDIIDQYRLSRMLGSGSYGIVFEAENCVSNQKCAIKIIPLCGRAGERELRALRQYHNTEHPNLLNIHHSGITGDYLYYTMDLADGKLADQHLDPSRLRSAAIKVADALAALHAHGLLHRDLKPDNLFSLNGEPLIGDIGLVTADCGASLTGTPGFLPAFVRKKGAALSEYSDLYALAKSFYCLLSGNPPGKYPEYKGPLDSDAAILLHAVLDVCDENGRIMTAADFRDVLRKGIVRKPRRKPWILSLGILCLTVAAIAVFIHWKPWIQPSRGEKMFTAVQKADRFSSFEQTSMETQQKVYESLKKQAKEQRDKLYPQPKGRTSFDTEVKLQKLYEELLEKAVRRQAEKSPEFRCFHVLWKEAEQASFVLYKLKDHPEYAEALEDEFRLWQQKYAEYCREREKLLSSYR